MNLVLRFCRGVGIAVVASYIVAAIVPGLNFRICIGPADRCALVSEAGHG